MRGERSGQVTMFVVVGLVLLLVVGFIFIVLTRAKEVRTGDNVKDTVQLQLLEDYVGNCIDAQVLMQLRNLASTGVMNTSLLSSKPFPSDKVGGVDVLYGITKNAGGALLPKAHTPPVYPDYHIPIADTHQYLDASTGKPTSTADDYPGYFGDVWLPGPCDANGPNRIGAQSAILCLRSGKDYPNDYPTGGWVFGPSLQEQFAGGIASGLQSCVSTGGFRSAVGRDVITGTPAVNVTYADTGLLVSVSYPMTLSGQNEQELLPFERRYNVRLLPFAQFARDLALKDTQQVLFDIDDKSQYSSLPTWREGFLVNATPTAPADTLPGVDIIEIVDTDSALPDGSTLTMRFLRAPSPPMIDPSFTEAGLYGSVWQSCTGWPVADPDEAAVECMFQENFASGVSIGGMLYVRKVLPPHQQDYACFTRDLLGQLVPTATCP